MKMENSEIELEQKRKKLRNLMDFGITDTDKEIAEGVFSQEYDRQQKLKVWKEIKFLDNVCPYSSIKNVIKDQHHKDGSLRFFINKNKTLRGKITNKIEDGIVDLPLIEKYEVVHNSKFGQQIETGVTVFGEKRKKDALIKDHLSHKFYIYRMVVKEGEDIQTYTVLSKSNLEIGEYEIQGMILELDDFSEITKYAKLVKKSQIMFINELKPTKITFKSKWEFMNMIREYKLNEDKIFENLLSINLNGRYLYFQHPRYFERLVGSFFLSAKFDSTPYPMHLVVIGKQGGGKSKAMEALSEKLDETLPIVEGSGSTMKSLIPSFKGDLTKPGALIESNRMVFIDEFFRILMRVDKDERENTLTHLNPLLEHKKRRFASGNNFLDAQMTSKMFAVTNPVFGTSHMDSLVKKMDNSFISRNLIWYQDENHYNEILNKKETDLKQTEIIIDNNLWRAIFDFCGSFKSSFDNIEYSKIHSEGLGKLGMLSEEVREIYKTRYKHHLCCLLDGIIKLRCIIEQDTTFEAKKEDYDKTKEIWFKMIETWKTGLENVRFELREGRFY